jgi:hypothetical protein
MLSTYGEGVVPRVRSRIAALFAAGCLVASWILTPPGLETPDPARTIVATTVRRVNIVLMALIFPSHDTFVLERMCEAPARCKDAFIGTSFLSEFSGERLKDA